MLPLGANVVTFDDQLVSPLPFKPFYFSLALSSYPFFSGENQVQTIVSEFKVLLAVAREIRLAPYELEQTQIAQKFGPVMLALQSDGVSIEVNALSGQAVRLRLWANECKIVA